MPCSFPCASEEVMHSQSTLCFALLLLMCVSLCVYILHLSLMSFAQYNTLLVQSLHWELRFCGSSSSSDSFCFCVFFLTSSQWTLSPRIVSLWCELWFFVFFFLLGIGNLFVCLFGISSWSSDSGGNGNWEVDGCNSFDGCACGDGNGGQHTSHLWHQWLFCLSTSCQVQLSKPIGWMLCTCRRSGSWNWPACRS